MDRAIALVDINSFYASCHQAVNPELKGQEVIVAGDPQNRTGIVLAASYPAKARGIKTGMVLWEAKKLCPNGYFFKPDFPLYVDFSARILRIMRDFSDLVEPFSIDEAFIDLTGVIGLFGPPKDIAVQLKNRIAREIGVSCSVGIGPNKLVAKMAADLQKPNGLTLLPTVEDFKRVFWGVPARELFGIGPRYEEHLKNLGVFTIGDLAKSSLGMLRKRWGKNGELLWYCANGMDNSPVLPGTLDTSKSIGHQKTLPRNLCSFEQIKIVLLELCEMVARRARQGGYAGRTVFLTLRDTQLCFLSRSMSMTGYSNLPDDIYQTACRLLDRHWNESWPVRLVGIALSNLITKKYEQWDIFGIRERQVKLAKACDTIRDRFGEGAILRCISLMEASILAHKKNNVLWEKHRMYLPDMREKATHRCKDCKFFVQIKGRLETRTGCVAKVRAYASLEKRVPEVLPAAELIKRVGLEGLDECLRLCNSETQSCGRFELRPWRKDGVPEH